METGSASQESGASQEEFTLSSSPRQAVSWIFTSVQQQQICRVTRGGHREPQIYEGKTHPGCKHHTAELQQLQRGFGLLAPQSNFIINKVLNRNCSLEKGISTGRVLQQEWCSQALDGSHPRGGNHTTSTQAIFNFCLNIPTSATPELI